MQRHRRHVLPEDDLVKAQEPQQLGLFESARQSNLEGVMDAVNARFGDGAVHRARDTGEQAILDHNVNLDFVDEEADEEDDEG